MKMVDVYDESTNKVVGSVPKYNAEEIAEMVDKAYAMQPIWEKTPHYERSEILYKFCSLVDKHAKEIALAIY